LVLEEADVSTIVDRPRYVCALGGALALMRAMRRTIPIVHAGAGCAYNYYIGGNAGAGYLGGGYCGAASTPSSNAAEREIIFGGEDRLREQIRSTIEIMDGDLYVVVSGCQVEMIGDDIRGAAAGVEDEKVLAVQTPGFNGNSQHGYDLLLEKLIRNFIPRMETKKDKTVNVFGLIPGNDVFYKGNLKEIKRSLGLIGVEANTFIGEGESLEHLRGAGSAALNIVLSDVYAPLSAGAFEEAHGIPFIREQMPIGFFQTEKFLRNIGGALAIDEDIIAKAVKSEEDIYFDYFERIADTYNDIDLQRYAIIAADSNYAPALAAFISDELGWIPHLVMITDPAAAADKEALEKRFKNYASGLEPRVHFNTGAQALKSCCTESWERNRNHQYYEALSQAVIFGSAYEKDFAEELGIPLLPVSFPVTSRVVFNKTYAGFTGGLSLAEDSFSLLMAAR
jgi:nitrogenase molybdenum-iron protein beta chain